MLENNFVVFLLYICFIILIDLQFEDNLFFVAEKFCGEYGWIFLGMLPSTGMIWPLLLLLFLYMSLHMQKSTCFVQ